MKILGIETSCDETASAIVENGVTEISSVVASSSDLHEKTGGVVPEVAARKQVEYIVPAVSEVLKQANLSSDEIDAIAVTIGPGLIGSLVVGVNAAKALSLAWQKPLVPVNHLVGHIYGNFVNQKEKVEFPAVVLIVSGGHTDLVLMKGHGDLKYLGGTLDDAAGEAFDKIARLLGISDYMGGPLLSKKASECKDDILKGKLPRPKINDSDFDFSFSGLKTAVKRMVENESFPTECVAHEFETAIIDVLVKKTIKAAKKHSVNSILLGGGVAANTQLRNRIRHETKYMDAKLYVPPIELCTDNAVYIASAAFFLFDQEKAPVRDIKADPSLGLSDY